MFFGGGIGMPLLKTVRIPEEHFDWALGQWFLAKKIEICPPICPRSHRVYE
jgi:hypothetical protein